MSGMHKTNPRIPPTKACMEASDVELVISDPQWAAARLSYLEAKWGAIPWEEIEVLLEEGRANGIRFEKESDWVYANTPPWAFVAFWRLNEILALREQEQ